MPLVDSYGRTINYLRVSVTDRCNLRCRYCMPPGAVGWLPPERILRFEEIAEVVRVAIGLGVTKIRLTGGEPLLRKGIEQLVGMLSRIAGIEDLAMTTNGILLAEHARGLAAAGLRRVNVSLDTVDTDRYAAVTQGGRLAHVLDGIRAAREAGLTPIKINSVRGPDADPRDAGLLEQFARDEGLQLRWIPQMDLAAGTFAVVEGGSGGDCPRCNRLRLTSDGLVRPCLFSNLGFSVRELGAAEALRLALEAKPPAGTACTSNFFHTIGG